MYSENNYNKYYLDNLDNKSLKESNMVIIESPEQIERDKALNKVFQANKLIRKPYRLTTYEKKIVLWLISKIRPNDIAFQRYRISAKAIQGLLGLKKRLDYDQWVKIFDDMRKKDVPVPKGKDGADIMVSWFASCRFHKEHGWADVSISPDLAPYLLEIQKKIKEERGFTAYKLGIILTLKSVYSIRIYELMKYAQWKRDIEIDLDELRRFLGIEGIKTYLRYCDINEKIIKPAQKELEESTDIKFTYEAKKWGRKTGAIKFYVSINEKNLPKEDTKDALESKIPDGILNLLPQNVKLGKKLYKILLDTYNKDRLDVEWAIRYTNAMSPKNYQAYLRGVIENRYFDGMKQMHLKDLEREKIEQEQNQKIATEEIERKKQIQQEQAEAEKIMDQFNELLEEERENIIEEYKAQMPKNQKSYFKANMKGIYSLSIRPYFCDFLKEKNYVPDG